MTDALRRLWRPIDSGSLVVFRIAFGAIMAWEVLRYFAYGWIFRYWIDAPVLFKYYGFEWVQPWPGVGMYLHFVALGVLGVFIAIGLWYRLSTILFFLGFTHLFLLQEAHYLNHFYLIVLLSFIMIFLPAHRDFSIDARRKPRIRSSHVPAWAVWILRFQIGVAYFYGGVAKIQTDWLQGRFMQLVFTRVEHLPLVGEWLGTRAAACAFAWGGVLFDLTIVPLLLWRRTQRFALVAAVAFHLTNAYLFSIGIFPWFMIVASTIFFKPDWPRRVRLLPAAPKAKRANAGRVSRPPAIAIALAGVYVVVQLLFPLRHFLIPGNVNWTEEGHRFSWHMKLRAKRSTAMFLVTAKDGSRWALDPKKSLPKWQVSKVTGRPDMILQFCHRVAERMRGHGYEDVAVYALVRSELNGREPHLLIDPGVNLAGVSRSWRKADWIVPLDAPPDGRAEELQRLINELESPEGDSSEGESFEDD